MYVSSAVEQPPVFLRLLAHDVRWTLLRALTRSDYRVHELVRLSRQPMNLVSYHLRKLRDHHLVTERRSSADGRDIYYSLDLDRLQELYTSVGSALHPGLAPAERTATGPEEPALPPPARVLFLCTQNSARSQMAEAIMRQLGGPSIEVFSAGSKPSPVHPGAIATMASFGIDISRARSKHLDEYCDQRFDYIITVCDQVAETCPVFPNDPERIHWSFPDPALLSDPAVRQRQFNLIATQLVTRIRYLLTLIEREKGKRE